MNLLKHAKLIQVKTSSVAGTSDITSDTVDTEGYDGVAFLVPFGTITSGAVTSIKAQQGAASGMGDAADLLGSAQTVADTESDKSFWMDLSKPRERYVRCIVDRGTQNAVVGPIFAILYGPRVKPVSHGTGISGGELSVSPAEGTA
ncbi:MAG: hypothetical protein K2Y22_04135 [Candidatus Obscuribacterales bacterium]|nr:hypothetical protein [Candidatus Obscuribacterales bacterium]